MQVLLHNAFENLTEKIRNKLHDMESTIKRL